jgi:hypothetical protein
LDNAAPGNTGGVDDAVDGSEASFGGLEGLLHLFVMADVGPQDQQLGPESGDSLEFSDLDTDRILSGMLSKPWFPGFFCRELRAANQNQASSNTTGQVLCQFQPDTS